MSRQSRLDLALREGNGREVIDFLRSEEKSKEAALIIYTAQDLTDEERAALGDEAEIVTKGRDPAEDVERVMLAALSRARSRTS